MTTRRILTTAIAAASLVLGIGAMTGAPAAATTAAAVIEPASAPSRTVATLHKSKIAITRTATPTTVKLNWPKHAKATRYLVIVSADSDNIVSATTTGTSATISSLDPAVRYTFIVTPMSAKASAKSMRAVMAHPLQGERATTTTPDAGTTPAVTPAVTAPAPSTGSSTSRESSVAASPSTPSAPKTTTVWECPAGYTDAGTDCVKTRAYTFHSETTATAYTYSDVVTTLAYAYHDEFVKTGGHFVSVARNAHGQCVSPGSVYADGCGYFVDDGYTVSVKNPAPAGYTDNGAAWTRTDRVKDATPAGYTDDGAQWVRTEQVKDATPAGYTDNGSQWVTHTAKVARQVAA